MVAQYKDTNNRDSGYIKDRINTISLGLSG